MDGSAFGHLVIPIQPLLFLLREKIWLEAVVDLNFIAHLKNPWTRMAGQRLAYHRPRPENRLLTNHKE